MLLENRTYLTKIFDFWLLEADTIEFSKWPDLGGGRPCHGGTGTFDVGSNLFKMGVTVAHSQTNTQSKPLNVIEEIKEA